MIDSNDQITDHYQVFYSNTLMKHFLVYEYLCNFILHIFECTLTYNLLFTNPVFGYFLTHLLLHSQNKWET